MVAAGLIVMLGFTALATDVCIQLRERRLAQTAADAAAIGGASQLLSSATGTTLTNNIQSVGQAAAAENGFTNSSGGATVTINTQSQSGPYAGENGYVEAIVSQSAPTVFMAVFGRSAMTVNARAVAGLGQGVICIYALSTSGTAVSGSNNGKINVPGCGVQDNSSYISVSGSANITAKYIGVSGTAAQNKGSTTTAPRFHPVPPMA